MGEDRRKKHEDFIEPGSKEDRELTAALNEAFDEINRRNEGRYRREKEAADRERERRSRSGLPLEDDCYFARLNRGLHVADEDLFGLYEESRVALRLTGIDAASPFLAGWEPDPKGYGLHEREMVRTLSRLRDRGGFVWLEYEHSKKARVGVVTPGTGIEVRTARRVPKKYGKKGSETGTEVALVTVRLEKVVYLQPDEEIALRACRPLVPDHANRSLVPWRPACGTSRLISMFDGHRKKDLATRWNDLPANLKTTVCVEFLRHHESPGVPRLKHLLLPPTNLGRDVDVFGVAEDGKEILAQVPFRQNPDKEGSEAQKKAGRLRRYENTGARLVSFVPGSGVRGEEPQSRGQKRFEDQFPIVVDEVIFIPVEEVLKWVEKQPGYAERLLSL